MEQVTSPMAIFDAVQRGGAAPDWVRDGVDRAWLGGNGHPDVRLIAVSENATFRVLIDGVPSMVVRLSQPGYVGDPANVRSELQWIEAIAAETAIDTPAPIRGTNGELVQFLTSPDGREWMTVAFEFVTGRILEEDTDLVPYFAPIGAATAVLHQHARGWTKPAGFVRFDWTLDDMVGENARWGSWERAALTDADREVLRRAQTQALGVLADLGPAVLERGLIHADLRPSNIMIEGDALTIIDFDDSGFGFYLYDFAAALTFYEHLPEATRMAASWLEGYAQVSPLTRPQLEAAAALSQIRRLTMLGWSTTHREDSLPPDLWNANLPGTVEVSARYLQTPLWLVEA
ncbi:phosphotransferase enzyme family protein [Subtercola endophyticus]|uniref:phosphotransferase enzyme family protein n=1 Tax=Subtercola endophyticus TaxID=2895559 RepID=UPI001E3AF66E|nr:phosphotransferase [Subtercola endophyticus]UFS58617.1 phosphotransferase [Subtercola endophyticus]